MENLKKLEKAARDKQYYKRNRVALLRRFKSYRDINRVRINRGLRDWYHNRGGKAIKTAWRQMREYGLTPEQVTALYQHQNNRCAICEATSSVEGRRSSLNIDHEHNETRRVRGLLCTWCNSILGRLEKQPKILKLCRPFQKYITSPPAKKLKIGGWGVGLRPVILGRRVRG